MIHRKTGCLVLLIMIFGSLLYSAPLELSGGALKLVLYPDTGSFSVLKLSEIGKNRYEPLFEDRNYSTTSWFSVSMNGRIFRLSPKNGKPVVLETTPSGAKFILTLTDDFQAEQEFSFVNDPSSGLPHAVKVETRIENTSGKPATFALKAVFDTMLGESEGIHFFTDYQPRISAETRIVPGPDPDGIIVSKNEDNSLMFMLYGTGVSVPASVTAANWERLNTLTWLPDVTAGRSFNTLYAVNDSALLFVWPEESVDANKKTAASVVLGPYSTKYVKTPAPAAQVDKTAESGIGALSPKQLLVQQLLARIDEIQANPDSASDEELKKLNDALDTLLSQPTE